MHKSRESLDKQQEAQMGYDQLLATEPCPNCKETVEQCACMRNICHKCGKPVGNITFTICDECWDIKFPPKS